MVLDIQRLGVTDASVLMALRKEALEAEPLAFAASPADDIGLVAESVRRSLEDRAMQAVFGQFDGADVVGMLGMVRAAKLKQRHKAMIWGMYVQPGARNQGIGRALLVAAIELARAWRLEQLQLSVTEAAPGARRLYESVGFQVWGREQRGLCWGGRCVDEFHLVLDIRTPS